MPPAPSLFCEHKKLRSTCMVCGGSRVGPAPARGPVGHDVDDSWHALRLECQARIRRLLERARAGDWSEAAYYEVYDRPPRREKQRSEEEDPSTFRGAFYLAAVKLFDVTVEGRRIQGYNGLADWDEMRDYLFRRQPPEAIPGLLQRKELLVHGGNGSWPRQQIATDLIRSPRLQEAVMLVAFGADGAAPDRCSDDEIARRLDALEALGREEGIEGTLVPFASKILHVFAPRRWPVLSVRSSPEVGAELGATLPEVAAPRDYLAFAEAVRAFAKAKGHADLDATDIVFSNQFDLMQVEGDDEDLPPLDE